MASKAKKTTALLLASLMCVGAFAGCNGNSNNGGTGSTAGGSSAGGTESTASTASTASSAGEASIPTVAEITERLKTEAKDGKISLKVWAPSNSKDFVKSMVEKFKTTYAVDGVTYEIKVVEKGEDKCINSLTEDSSKGADVFQVSMLVFSQKFLQFSRVRFLLKIWKTQLRTAHMRTRYTLIL